MKHGAVFNQQQQMAGCSSNFISQLLAKREQTCVDIWQEEEEK